MLGFTHAGDVHSPARALGFQDQLRGRRERAEIGAGRRGGELGGRDLEELRDRTLGRARVARRRAQHQRAAAERRVQLEHTRARGFGLVGERADLFAAGAAAGVAELGRGFEIESSVQPREQPAEERVARAGRVDHADLRGGHRSHLAIGQQERPGSAERECDQLRAGALRKITRAVARGAGRDDPVERAERRLEHVGEPQHLEQLLLRAEPGYRVRETHVEVDHRARAGRARELEYALHGRER